MKESSEKKLYEPYGGIEVELPPPPPCFVNMKAVLTDYKPGVSLTVSFPVLDVYLNPGGSMQGEL